MLDYCWIMNSSSRGGNIFASSTLSSLKRVTKCTALMRHLSMVGRFIHSFIYTIYSFQPLCLLSVNYVPSRLLHDTTIKTSAQVRKVQNSYAVFLLNDQFLKGLRRFGSMYIILITHNPIIFQAKSEGLSTGHKRVAGKGDRLLVIGIGGPNGWVDWQVWKRAPNKNLPENPKDDMGNI